jgi:AmmeMemoRadiSam system protein A
MDTPCEELDRNEEEFLLDVARKTIIEHTERGTTPNIFSDKPRLDRNCGAFVTLHEQSGALRGCIGYVEAIKPLLQTVIEMAVACSSRDPRFSPVTPDELENLDLEISVITPLKQIHQFDDICVGKHGLMIRKGSHSGLLLPQVATDFGWDRERFLEEMCHKAGLEKDAWKEDDARVFIFSAQVFGGKLIPEQTS